MPDRIEQKMMRQFHAVEVACRACDALDLLRAEPEKPLILLTSGTPASLLLREDQEILASAGTRPVEELLGQLPPVVVKPVGMTLEALVESPEYSAFSFGARGVVLTQEGQPAGVLPAEWIDRYLGIGYRSGPTRGPLSYATPPSDHELPGVPSTAPIVIHCSPFGHRNELQFLSRRSAMECQVKTPYPHSLL
jgi:hypothetical protein